MTFDVKVLRRAKREVSQVVRWLHERSPRGADAWHQLWLHALKRLKSHADTCGLAPEDELSDETVRHILFMTRRGNMYRALFIIRGQVAYVFSLRGPGQDLLCAEDIEIPDDLEGS